MRAMLRIVGVLLGLSLGLLGAVSAQGASLVVSPPTVQPGGSVTISGDVLVPPDNHVPGELAQGPGQVTLFSTAFPGGTNTVPGGVSVPVGTDGHFSTQMPIRSDAPPGSHTVTGRFAGANIGASAQFTVAGAAAGSPATATPAAPTTGQPATAQPTPTATPQAAGVQLPGWWPAALAALLVLVLSPWVGIVLLWRKRLR